MARFCKHCGAPLSDNAKFCKNCGQAVPAPASNNTQTVYQTPVQNVQMSVNGVCPNCGSQIRPGAKFCRVCGMSVGNNMSVMIPGNTKDKTLPVKVILGIVCVALFIVGVMTIPGNIKAARAGTHMSLFSSSDTPAFDYEEFGTLTEQQIDEYAYIDEAASSGVLNDDVSYSVHTHENYLWLYEDDSLDKADRE